MKDFSIYVLLSYFLCGYCILYHVFYYSMIDINFRLQFFFIYYIFISLHKFLLFNSFNPISLTIEFFIFSYFLTYLDIKCGILFDNFSYPLTLLLFWESDGNLTIDYKCFSLLQTLLFVINSNRDQWYVNWINVIS